jgi:hypothetical protein
MDRKQRRLRKIIIIPTAVIWIVANLYYLWVKIAGGIFILTGLIELLCFLTVLISLIILLFRLIRKREWRNRKNYITIAFTVLVAILLNVPQLRVNENTLQSPVKIRCCYEGTMNTSQLYLRENGTFERFNIGWFAYVHYSHGTWGQNGDTIYFKFVEEKPHLLSEKMVIKDEYLYRIQADT